MITFNTKEEKQNFIESCLEESLREVDKLTTGNISHQKAQLRFIIDTLLQIFKESHKGKVWIGKT